MTRDRGIRLQAALAAYLTRWWPNAESTPSGRPGSDVTGTPGVVWECKTAAKFSPQEFARQARRHARAGELPVTVYFPPGVGAGSTGQALAILPLDVMMRVLADAEWAPRPAGDAGPHAVPEVTT